MVMLIIKIIGVVFSLLLTMMMMTVLDIVIIYDTDTNKDDIHHCC